MSVTEPMQVLMLGLGGEIFAVDAGLVREVIDPIAPTRVAGARPHLPAVINVRGNVIPLADLRLRFGMPECAATTDTRIVVVELPIEGEPVIVGLMADKVYEVTAISGGQTQATPRVGMSWPPDFIRAIATWNDQFVIIPDLERILN